MKRATHLALTIVTAGALALTALPGLACAADSKKPVAGAASSTPAPVKTYIDTSQLTAAPDFKLVDLTGKVNSLADYRGKVMILDFWATWCGPCRMEIPHFIEMQKLYGEKGLQIVGVSLDQGGKDDVVPFAKNKGINYDMLLGTNEAAMAYGGVKGIPTTFVITQDGKIYKKYVGVRPRETFESDVKALLGISS